MKLIRKCYTLANRPVFGIKTEIARIPNTEIEYPVIRAGHSQGFEMRIPAFTNGGSDVIHYAAVWNKEGSPRIEGLDEETLRNPPKIENSCLCLLIPPANGNNDVKVSLIQGDIKALATGVDKRFGGIALHSLCIIHPNTLLRHFDGKTAMFHLWDGLNWTTSQDFKELFSQKVYI